MDVGTHALASLAVTRALAPRAPLWGWVAIVLAGTIADVDALSALASPAAYLDWHHALAHSIVVSLAAGALLSAACFLADRKIDRPHAASTPLITAVIVAGLLHLALDACQADGIMAFWPFSTLRIAADWLAAVDPWIIVILITAILLPELSRLVSDEIGAKSRRPRGRIGATMGFVFLILYIGMRANFHASALATLQARTYRGETAKRVAVYAEPVSLFTWRGIVETDRALQELIINSAPGSAFDPENGTVLFKPEPSLILERAQETETAKKSLRVASFPKAAVEKTSGGYEIQIRDLRYAVTGEIRREVLAVVRTDSNGRVVDDEFLWASDLRRR
jgi:membrane-bound metal-dependent hydrolase YbcI (DUF457 family)